MPNPVQSFNNAIAAYSNAAKGRDPGLEARDVRPSDEFVDLVKGALKQSVDNAQTGESQTMNAVNDRANIADVVTSVAEAELTLQTVMAVRDKVLEAYKEILRMPM